MKLRYFFYAAILTLLTVSQSCNSSEKQNTKTTQPQSESTDEQTSEKGKTILFFGNSLTAGYGVEEGEGFAEIIGKKLDSLGYDYRVINAGISGETTSSGLRRVDWVMSKQEVDVFVLELGANDGLRGIPTSVTRSNLYEIIDKVREAQPDVKIVLAGMMVPPNMGQSYSDDFQSIFPDVADTANVELIPFLLKDVGGIDSLNQDDGIHPNPKGHRILAKNTWDVLKDVIEKEKSAE
ncbi:arylesterase [Halocola ammonii]